MARLALICAIALWSVRGGYGILEPKEYPTEYPAEPTEYTTYDYTDEQYSEATEGPISQKVKFRCLSDGLFAYPPDCTRFIQCSNGRAFVMNCPEGLHFSRRISRCDYPCEAQCSTAISEDCRKKEKCPLIDCIPGCHLDTTHKPCPTCVCDNPPECPLINCIRGCHLDTTHKPCPTCVCDNPPANEVCTLPSKTGECKSYVVRYYYDVSESKCKKFVYGGCRGNGNNFKSEKQCMEICGQGGSCGVNEVYSACNGHCSARCDNLNPICITQCIPGCICQEGFAKNENGVCIPVRQCPQKKKCSKDEQYYDCTPSCKNTCKAYFNPGVRCACGPPGCYCKEGLVKNDEGKCVKPETCPNKKCYSPNEEYSLCANPCNDCEIKGKCNFLVCNKGCDCISGYYRDELGICIPERECPAKVAGDTTTQDSTDTYSTVDPSGYDYRLNFPQSTDASWTLENDASSAERDSMTYAVRSSTETTEDYLPHSTDISPEEPSEDSWGSFPTSESQTTEDSSWGGESDQPSEHQSSMLPNEDSDSALPGFSTETSSTAYSFKARVVEDFECRGSGAYRNPDDCASFIWCPLDTAIVVPCPPNTHYSRDRDECVDPCLAHCNSSLACACGWPECHQYNHFDCESGPDAGPCSDRQLRYFYDRETGRCKSFYYGGCHGNGNNYRTLKECQRECQTSLLAGFRCPSYNGDFGHYPDCVSYYQCKRGIPTLKRCPKGTAFHHLKAKCVPEEEAMCVYECREPNAVYPAQRDCRSYIDCVNGIPKLQKCPRGLAFDIKKGNCVLERFTSCTW